MSDDFNWTPVVMVEGLSLDRTTTDIRPTGLAFLPDPLQSAPEGRVTGAWRPALLSIPELTDLTWSPIEGNSATQSLTFILSLDEPDDVDDRQGTLIRSYFLGDPDPVAILAFGEVVTPTTTSFDVTMLDGTDADATFGEGSVMYLGSEVFRVTSASTDTVTIVNALPSSYIYPDGGSDSDLTRSVDGVSLALGHLGSRVSTHTGRASASAAPPYEDDRVYTANQRLRGRRVWLFRCAVVGGELIEQLLGQFVIAGNESITMNEDATELTVTCSSIVGAFDGYQFNTRSVQWRRSFYTINDGTLVNVNGDRESTFSFENSIWKNYAITVLQAGQVVAALVGDRYLAQDIRMGGDTPDVAELNTEGGLDAPSIPKTTFNEALSTNPFDVVRLDTDTLTPDPTLHPYYSVDKPDPDDPASTSPGILRHPLHMWLAHLGCLSSNLPLHWKLPFALDSVNVTNVLALARGQAGSIREWPGIVAGGDGQPLPAMKWLDESFLKPLGMGRVQDQYGRMDVAPVYAPRLSTASLTGSNTLQGRKVYRPVKLAADALTARLGMGVGSASLRDLSSLDVYLPDAGSVQSESVEIIAQGVLSADEPTTDLATLDGRPGVAFVRAYLSSIGQWFRRGMAKVELVVALPELNVMDPENVQPLVPGSLVDVDLIGLIDITTGAKQQVGGYQGIVIRHLWENQCTEQSVTIGLYRNRLVRYGFSLLITVVVDNMDGTYTLTFDDTESIAPDGTPGPNYVSPAGEFATDLATAVDTQTTYSADNVSVVDQYFAQRFVGTMANNVLTAGTAPIVGDWIVLADLGDGNDTAESTFAYFGRDKYGV